MPRPPAPPLWLLLPKGGHRFRGRESKGQGQIPCPASLVWRCQPPASYPPLLALEGWGSAEWASKQPTLLCSPRPFSFLAAGLGNRQARGPPTLTWQWGWGEWGGQITAPSTLYQRPHISTALSVAIRNWVRVTARWEKKKNPILLPSIFPGFPPPPPAPLQGPLALKSDFCQGKEEVERQSKRRWQSPTLKAHLSLYKLWNQHVASPEKDHWIIHNIDWAVYSLHEEFEIWYFC